MFILKLFKWIVYLVILVALVIGGLYGLLIYVNHSDESVSEDTRYFLDLWDEAQARDGERNAYVGMMGFHAPAGESIWRNGEEIVEASLACSSPSWEQSCVPSFNALNLSPQISRYAQQCNRRWPQCRQWLSGRELEPMEQDLAALERYRALLDSDHYKQDERLSPFQRFLPASDIQQVQKLYLLSLREADLAQTRTLLERDHSFWRMLMSQCDTLTCKTVATAGLRQHYLLATVLLMDASEAKQEAASELWSTPVSAEQRSLKFAFAGEMQFAIENAKENVQRQYLKDVGERLDKFDSLGAKLYQPQATVNLHSAIYRQVVNASQMPVSALPGYLESLEDDSPSHWSDLSLYNPVGQILVAVTAPTYTGYASRVASVEGIRQLALVRLSLNEKYDILSQLEQSDYQNPATGEPFDYDLSRDQITFSGLEPEVAYSLPL